MHQKVAFSTSSNTPLRWWIEIQKYNLSTSSIATLRWWRNGTPPSVRIHYYHPLLPLRGGGGRWRGLRRKISTS